jgi:hypothetical protein
MPEGTITARGSSPKGKPTVTIDGKLFYAGNTDLTGLVAGDRIAYTATSFAEGRLWGIDRGWKLIEGEKKYPPSVQPHNGITAPVPSGALLSVTDVERPCVSNWGAELIKAGVVKEPADLGIWVNAALHALRGN